MIFRPFAVYFTIFWFLYFGLVQSDPVHSAATTKPITKSKKIKTKNKRYVCIGWLHLSENTFTLSFTWNNKCVASTPEGRKTECALFQLYNGLYTVHSGSWISISSVFFVLKFQIESGAHGQLSGIHSGTQNETVIIFDIRCIQFFEFATTRRWFRRSQYTFRAQLTFGRPRRQHGWINW